MSNYPPEPIDVVAECIRQARFKTKLMPVDPVEAARWWIEKMPPLGPGEKPEFEPRGEDGHWKTPYTDRLVYTLKRWLVMKHIYKTFILENCASVPWKGEHIEFYASLVKHITGAIPKEETNAETERPGE